MLIFIAILSILIIAIITGLISNRLLPFYTCPICAGVSGTWIWMLIAYYLGYNIDVVVPAILMGGSVVGISYKIEEYLLPTRSLMIFKTIFIIFGFLAVFGLIDSNWLLAVVSIVAQIIVATSFLAGDENRRSKSEMAVIKKLKEKMKKCC